MIFYILFLKHTICHRFRIQNDIFPILLPKQISSLGTGSGPVPTSPPPLFGTRFWQETNRKIAPEELCRSKFPYNRARSWQKSLHSGPPKRRKSHVLSRIFATFGLKKHRTHIIGSDLEGPRGQIPYCCIADLAYRSVGRECDDAACRSDPTFTRASPGLRS